MPSATVIFRAWDGVERKNALQSTPVQKARHARAVAARSALIPLVAEEVGRAVRADHDPVHT